MAAQRNTPSCGLMSDATAQAIVNRIGQDLEPGDHIHFAFQGGEPTLAGLSWDYWDYNEFCKNRQIKAHCGLYFETQS